MASPSGFAAAPRREFHVDLIPSTAYAGAHGLTFLRRYVRAIQDGSPLPASGEDALAALLNGLKLFSMGYSWGGYESLILPFDPRAHRTAVPWTQPGNCFRLHVGFEDFDDLKAELAAGLGRYRAAAI